MNKEIFLSGIPDDQGKRALCWRLLLNYLPPERRKWEGVLQEKRNLYKQFISKTVLFLSIVLITFEIINSMSTTKKFDKQ